MYVGCSYRVWVCDVLVECLADACHVRVRPAKHPLPVPLAEEDCVDGADVTALVGQLVQVRYDGDFMGHCDCGAKEPLVCAEFGEEVGHVEGLEEEEGPFQGEGVVDCLVHEGGEGVGDWVAEEVGVAL